MKTTASRLFRPGGHPEHQSAIDVYFVGPDDLDGDAIQIKVHHGMMSIVEWMCRDQAIRLATWILKSVEAHDAAVAAAAAKEQEPEAA
jgi:hypothetical protein